MDKHPYDVFVARLKRHGAPMPKHCIETVDGCLFLQRRGGYPIEIKNPVSMLADCTCQACGKRGGGRTVVKTYWRKDPGEKLGEVWTRLCKSCDMKAAWLVRKWEQADALRIQVDRIKRKQRESTKDNA